MNKNSVDEYEDYYNINREKQNIEGMSKGELKSEYDDVLEVCKARENKIKCSSNTEAIYKNGLNEILNEISKYKTTRYGK